MELTHNAKVVLDGRYRQKDENGNFLETHEDIFRRVAKNVASVETTEELQKKWEEIFFREMTSKNWMPNTPTICNAGTNNGLGYNACYIAGLEDSIISERTRKHLVQGNQIDPTFNDNANSITDAIQICALITKTGGGIGYTLDKLRPTGDWISTSKSESGGPMGFWHVLAAMSGAMQQGGKRRGANMMTMSLWHPDILKFITAKDEFDPWMTEILGYKARRFGNFNISVKISDTEMEFITKHPYTNFYVTNPRTGKQYLIPKTTNIKNYQLSDLEPYDLTTYGLRTHDSDYYTYGDIWKMIVDRAHAHADPGILFWDRAIERNMLPKGYEPITTNPCGEIIGEANMVCNLASLNLSNFVNEDLTLDIENMLEAWSNMIRFLDNVVDATPYPTIDIKINAQKWRRLGAGIMGLADMFFKMRIPYDSDEAFRLSKKIGTLLKNKAIETSQALFKEKGCSIEWKQQQLNRFYHSDFTRNAYLTMCAPTGSISIIADCSAGIEPLFSLVLKRQVMRDHTGKVANTEIEINKHFEAVLDKDFPISKKYILQYCLDNGGKISNITKENILFYALNDNVSNILNIEKELDDYYKLDSLKRIFKTAMDVHWKDHVEVQSIWTNSLTSSESRYSQSISKTINLEASASIEDVDNLYKLAWSKGCIGITMYRNGSHDGQPMTVDKKESVETGPIKEEINSGNPSSSSDIYNFQVSGSSPEINKNYEYVKPNNFGRFDTKQALILKAKTSMGNLRLVTGIENDKIQETFVIASKQGTDVASLCDALGRTISIALQNGVEDKSIIDTLRNISGGSTAMFNGITIKSIPDGIAKMLEQATGDLSSMTPVENTASKYQKEIVPTSNEQSQEICPDCGDSLIFTAGCKGGMCQCCGYSKC